MAKNRKYIHTSHQGTKEARIANYAQVSALAADTKKRVDLISQIVSSFTGRIRQDIKTWRSALQAAELEENPQRYLLYTVYKDVELDDQVLTCIANQKAQLKAEQWKLADADGAEKPEATALLRKPWFYEFIDAVIKSTHQGFVLLEVAGTMRSINSSTTEIAGFTEVPRNAVNPELGIVTANIGDTAGIDYNNPAFAKTVIAIGKAHSLGILNACAPRAIYKKNAEAAWSEFAEMFGMPIRLGKVASRNPKDVADMELFLQNMGSAAYAVMGADDSIEIKESSRGDAYKVYAEMIARQDRGIAKLILGQTMTTDNGSSRSQAEVHERVSEHRMLELKMLVEFTINYKLLPLLIANGYPLTGLSFQWDNASNISEIDIAQDTFLTANFEFENLDYFAQKYRVPITALRAKNELATEVPDASADKKGKPTPKEKKEKLSQTQALNLALDVLYNQPHNH
jgi:hypothetical protein